VTHRWGICPKYLNNWFSLDRNRKNKTKFIELVIKGKKTRPSFTPDFPDKVFKIIWEVRTEEGQKFAKSNLEVNQPKNVELTEANIDPMIYDKQEVK
jgi:hypothetical protein